MLHNPTPTMKRHLTKTITVLTEQSRAVLMDAEVLRAQSTVMRDELHRVRGGTDLLEPGGRDDRAAIQDARPVQDEE